MAILSIIVPIYNTAEYLCQCIDSILSQGFTDYELILINDGSTDESGEICGKYAEKDKRIRVFSQENKGVSSARNLGIDNAEGQFLMFCDSDDTVADDALEKIMSYVLAKNNDITMCTYIMDFNGFSQTEQISFDETGFGSMCEVMCGYTQQIAPWSACRNIIRRSLVTDNNIRYNSSYSSAEDCDFYFNLCRYCASFGSINQPIIRYRKTRENSASNTYSAVNIKSISMVYEKWQNFFADNYGMNAEPILRFFSENYYYLIFDTARQKNYSAVKVCQEYRHILRYVRGWKKRIVVMCYNIVGVDKSVKWFRGKLNK